MSFRGELREFELPDILQLISSQQKAGWLKVISKGNCHFVFFRDGKITSTKNPADEKDPLEDYIARKGLLTDDQMDRVAAVRRKTGMDVQDILQKEGLLDADDIQEIFDAMVEQDIFELMSIRSGTYEFETEERPGPLPEGSLAAEIGPILMEGARKADEVSEMRKALGPEDGVLVLTPVGREAKPESVDERALLELVNGVRGIDTVIEDSGLDRYTATRALFDCARQGWVSLLKKHHRAVALEDAADGEFELGRALRWLGPVVALLLTAVLFSDVLDRFRVGDPLVGEWRNRAAQLDAARLKEGVRLAVEAYKVSHDSYPETLDALVEDGFLPRTAIRDRGQPLWAYGTSSDGEQFVLLPAGREEEEVQAGLERLEAQAEANERPAAGPRRPKPRPAPAAAPADEPEGARTATPEEVEALAEELLGRS
jgi:hypothetical protein